VDELANSATKGDQAGGDYIRAAPDSSASGV